MEGIDSDSERPALQLVEVGNRNADYDGWLGGGGVGECLFQGGCLNEELTVGVEAFGVIAVVGESVPLAVRIVSTGCKRLQGVRVSRDGNICLWPIPAVCMCVWVCAPSSQCSLPSTSFPLTGS